MSMKKNYKFSVEFSLAFACILFSIGNLLGQTEWISFDNNPLFDIGSSSTWESASNAQPSVIFDGEIYHMWYSGESNTGSRIGFATSVDGIHWEKYQGNPVIEGIADSWENDGVSSPYVIWDGAIFHMWYAGFQITTKVTASIGYATSSDGINWIKHESNPILAPTQSWEGGEICIIPKVVFVDSIFHMWYASGHSFDQQNPAKEYKIGYATSTDGINWIKNENNPVLEITGYSAEPSTIILKDSLFQMWFSCDFFPDNRWRIGYATSSDGINWHHFENNPVVDVSSSSWEIEGVAWPSVLLNETGYNMWYTGIGDIDGQVAPRIGFAISPILEHDIWAVTMPEQVASVPILVNNYIPRVNVWNVGLSGESNVSITCKIDSSNTNLYNDSNTIAELEAGQSNVIHFEKFRTFDNDTFAISFYSTLQNDENLGNDTLRSIIEISNAIDDFEAGLENWTSNFGWGITTQLGENCINDNPGSVYENGVNNWIQYNYGFNLSGLQAAHIKFRTTHLLQSNDFGYVEASVDGGATWNQLGEACTGFQSSWVTQTRSLTQFCGPGFDDVRIRFRLVTDESVASLGWFLDDIEIYPEEISTVVKLFNKSCYRKNYELFYNYPNPFNAQTSIGFQVPKSGNVKIAIYNVLGQEIASLVNDKYQAGSFKTIWDGKDVAGNIVPSGVYFYRMEADGFSLTKKMLLLE